MGQGGVGKTAMVTKFTSGEFNEAVSACGCRDVGALVRVRGTAPPGVGVTYAASRPPFSVCSTRQQSATCTPRTWR